MVPGKSGLHVRGEGVPEERGPQRGGQWRWEERSTPPSPLAAAPRHGYSHLPPGPGSALDEIGEWRPRVGAGYMPQRPPRTAESLPSRGGHLGCTHDKKKPQKQPFPNMDLLAVQGTLNSFLQHHSSKAGPFSLLVLLSVFWDVKKLGRVVWQLPLDLTAPSVFTSPKHAPPIRDTMPEEASTINDPDVSGLF